MSLADIYHVFAKSVISLINILFSLTISFALNESSMGKIYFSILNMWTLSFPEVIQLVHGNR